MVCLHNKTLKGVETLHVIVYITKHLAFQTLYRDPKNLPIQPWLLFYFIF